jgi:hypothetical protein
VPIETNSNNPKKNAISIHDCKTIGMTAEQIVKGVTRADEIVSRINCWGERISLNYYPDITLQLRTHVSNVLKV